MTGGWDSSGGTGLRRTLCPGEDPEAVERGTPSCGVVVLVLVLVVRMRSAEEDWTEVS